MADKDSGTPDNNSVIHEKYSCIYENDSYKEENNSGKHEYKSGVKARHSIVIASKVNPANHELALCEAKRRERNILKKVFGELVGLPPEGCFHFIKFVYTSQVTFVSF